jgi:hypothetical protein
MSGRRLAVTAATILLLATSGSPLFAQGACLSTDVTVGDCWKRLYNPKSAETEMNSKKDETAAISWQQLAGKATGLNTSMAQSSAIEDFLPLLRMALVGDGQPSSTDLKALDFERKIPLPTGSPLELKLRGNRNDPDVYDPLKMKFAADVRDQEVAKLKGQLGEFDDYSLTLSGNVVSSGYGRSWAKGGPVFGDLFSQMVKGTSAALATKAQLAFGDAVATASKITHKDIDEKTAFQDIPEPARTDLQVSLASAAQELKGNLVNLKTLADNSGIFKVADLVNNQPQINGSATYRARRGLAGPSELSLKASYEMGYVNLNQLLRRCGATPELTCYSTYVNDAATTAALEHGDRVALSVEYKDHRAFKASLPADGIDLDLPSGRSLVASVTYGRYIDVKALGDSNSRIDLSGSYENVSDDPSRRDRGVVSLTFSNRFLTSMGASLGISYANHSEFLSKSDHVVSAHFAISYKLLPDKPTT